MGSTILVHDASVPEPTARSVPIRVTLDLKPTEHRALKRWCNQAAVDLDLPQRLPLAAVLRLLGEELIRSTRLARCIRARLLEPDTASQLTDPGLGTDVGGVTSPVSMGGDEQGVLKYLDDVIQRRDHAVAQAYELRAEAHRQFARQLGDLVEAVVTANVPVPPRAAERILHAMRHETEAPAEAVVSVTPGHTALSVEEARCPEGDVRSQANASLQPTLPALPTQAARPAAPQAAAVTARTRALEIVRETDITTGINVDTLMRRLGAENHAVYGRQVRNWLSEWVTERKIRRLRDGFYIRAGVPADQFTTPTLATSMSAPLLLRRAYQIVVATPDGEMSSRDLAAALGSSDSGLFGAQLCAQMRAVGVTRLNKGKIRARLKGAVQIGYTAETLGRAIAAYNKAETESRAVKS
ncbi:hypothetical protein [Streptomyces scopuliridis]|uniref:hypothetical protein n=1 Tax=Streptomyces scopuliridis TaxID=452529 RepID=UPI0036B6A3A0